MLSRLLASALVAALLIVAAEVFGPGFARRARRAGRRLVAWLREPFWKPGDPV